MCMYAKPDPGWDSVYSRRLDGKCQVPEQRKAKRHMEINQIIVVHADVALEYHNGHIVKASVNKPSDTIFSEKGTRQ